MTSSVAAAAAPACPPSLPRRCDCGPVWPPLPSANECCGWVVVVTVAVARSSLSSLRAASPQRRAMSLVFVRPSVDCHSTTVPYRCLLVAPMIYLCSSVSSVPSIPGTPSFLCAVLCFSRRSLAASLDCPFRPCGDVLALVPSQCIHRPCCSRGHATACPFIRRPTRFPLPSHLSSVADQTGRLLGYPSLLLPRLPTQSLL